MPRFDHYALLVAINTYPGLTNLAGPENDAAEFARWLKDPAGGDVAEPNVRLILSSDFKPAATEPYDASPTERELIHALDRWLRKPGGWHDRVGERLYLFFAGHGFTAGSSISDPALFSAVAQSGDTAHIAAYRYASKIANAGFFDEIVLVMDCCQDVLKATAVVEPSWAPPDRNKASRVKLLQAYGAPRGKKSFERALVTGAPVRGLFSSVWIEALRSAPSDADGRVTGALVKGRLQRLWGEQFRAECDYDPPVRLPDGEDICLLRRGVRRTQALPEPMAPVTDTDAVPGADIVSAAPILGTRTSHEYQHHPAVGLAQQARLRHVAPDADAELFIFLRESSTPPVGFLDGSLHLDALAINSLGEDRSHPLQALLEVHAQSGFAATRLALAAGCYALGMERIAAGTEFVLSLPIQLVAGWRTEIYVDCIELARNEGGPADRVFDLANAAVFMAVIADKSPLGSGLGLRTERVRKLLSAGQPVKNDASLRQLLLGTPASPMLSLYAACYLATSRRPDLALATAVLRQIPAEFRDVSTDVLMLERWRALAANEAIPEVRRVSALPILAASWEIAKRLPGGLGLGAPLHASIGQWRLGGSVWACWQHPKHLALELRRELWARPSESEFAHAAAPAQAVEPTTCAAWSAGEWHRASAGLRYPEPTHSPFQQALRRRILDLLDSDDDWPQGMLAELAKAFGLNETTALQDYQGLYRAASAAAETQPTPDQRKRHPR